METARVASNKRVDALRKVEEGNAALGACLEVEREGRGVVEAGRKGYAAQGSGLGSWRGMWEVWMLMGGKEGG